MGKSDKLKVRTSDVLANRFITANHLIHLPNSVGSQTTHCYFFSKPAKYLRYFDQ